jgi:hypothetical protein
MHVVFHRRPGHRYLCHVHRDDGIVVSMPGYDRKWRVPQAALRAAGDAWHRVASSGSLELRWPLAVPAPARPAVRRRPASARH